MGDMMVPTLQDRYVVLTGDLKSSRELEDRARAQEDLKNALTIINKRFEDAVIAKFTVVGGDSFQGMMSSPKYLFDIYHVLFENISHPFYLGVGVGGISTHLSENVGEMDGEAFHNAFDALEQAKKEILNFTADVMWSWTGRQKEVVMHYKKVKVGKAMLHWKRWQMI